ncbi:LacI family DNA-binding transcriptional regulator [Lachnoclostridium sp. Marseille-P6806]|uniref:LacI family DNA-binding transcriptional regulator n=1 Tax=Lachnoclostridium sp. Marseille-P6806 TaxID=2364793 RepID=UPI001030E931|nr:LacI family DNA-binding transcriptional regulator [Lachnoclostridium sp. Marseille-P6806]
MRLKNKVTFDDIASYTGFSKTTVSRYFNNPDSLTAENQATIARALKKLNYHENKVGRILASGHTEFIGLIVPNLYMHFFAETLQAFLATYNRYGYKFLVFEGNRTEDEERRYISELLAYNVEGMIVMSHTIPSEELAGYGIPLVTIEREDRCVSSVNTDNLMGGIQATSLLYKNNCDILFYIDGINDHIVPAQGRQIGFEQICQQQKIAHEVILREIGHSYEESYRVISGSIDDIAIRHSGKRKGIFCANDTYASMVVTHLVRSYGSFPDDFRLIGFDGSPISAQTVVPFSTIGQQIDKIVEATMELLIEQIQNRTKRIPVETPVRHKVITPVLICRDTSRPDAFLERERHRYE